MDKIWIIYLTLRNKEHFEMENSCQSHAHVSKLNFYYLMQKAECNLEF